MTTFRVYFVSGSTIDVDAEHPDDARAAAAKERRGERIAKVKVIKEKADA